MENFKDAVEPGREAKIKVFTTLMSVRRAIEELDPKYIYSPESV